MTTLADEFRRALDHAFAASNVSYRIDIGPFAAELFFQGRDTAEGFLPSFPQPAEPGGPPDLSFAIWLGPDPVMSRLVPHPRSQNRDMAQDGYYCFWQTTPGEALQLYDRSSRRALLWLPKRRALESMRSRPGLPLIHAHADDGPWAPVHAAAFGLDGRFLLAVGQRHSGKSTAAVICAAAGWTYAGDDFVLVDPVRRLVAPIYASARLRPAAAAVIGDYAMRAQVVVSHDWGEPRHELRLGTGFVGARIGGGRIAAALLLRRAGAALPTVQPANRKDVFAAIANDTTLQLPGLRGSLTRKLLAIASSLPAYMVDTGNDPQAVPAAFEDLLGEV